MLIAIIIVVLLALLLNALFSKIIQYKYFHKKWLFLKYEHEMNLSGIRSVVEDFIARKQNDSFVPEKRNGKVALITGGTRGIGAEVVKGLLSSEVHVIIGCRNISAAHNLLEYIRMAGVKTGTLDVFELDVGSIKSIRSFAKSVQEKYSKIDILINNAGIMFVPYIETEDGFESQFATNYLGHFLLSSLLLPQLKAAGSTNCNARIVNVSSCAHTLGKINLVDINNKELYVSSMAYAQSKFAQVLFTNYLNRKLREEEAPVSVFTVHPGVVNTELFIGSTLKRFGSTFMTLFFKTPEQGAKSILYTSLSSDLDQLGGCYITNCEVNRAGENANCRKLQEALFNLSKNLLSIEKFGDSF